jgi:hypothetical protein
MKRYFFLQIVVIGFFHCVMIFSIYLFPESITIYLKNTVADHPRLLDSPRQRGSSRTFRSINLRQSMPLAITRCHGLLTNSLENKDFASNKCRIFSARLAVIYQGNLTRI